MKKKKVLFCFPYAGGSGMIYMPWRRELSMDVIPLEYRGHATRRKEPLDSSIEDIARDMAVIIVNTLDGSKGDFSLFGHSMGGLVAYRTARILQEEYGLLPQKVFISACCATKKKFSSRNYSGEIPIGLIKHAGISEDVIDSELFQKSILPIMRNDLRLVNSFFQSKEMLQKIDCSIVCFSGKQDEFDPYDSMLDWSTVTSKITYIMFEGGHFFFEDEQERKRMFHIIEQEAFEELKTR